MPNNKWIAHIVEFDDISNENLKIALEADDIHVVSSKFEEEGLARPTNEPPDLVILSIHGDQEGALACCRNFRSACPNSAIFLIHEDFSEWEESVALELGADAVVRRPSDSRRVMAQVRSLLRRQGHRHTPGIQLLTGSRTVTVNNQAISFTDAEFELLSVLAKQPGSVVSRDTISRHLRGLAYDSRDRSIDLRIARIRQKLGDKAHHPLFIRTVRGEGYMLMADET
ncbi:MAG: response regulator transcription factor [Gemmatimonadales bacterium]|nr:response regulator transcription factor [Gemmatimonadales bacterium]